MSWDPNNQGGFTEDTKNVADIIRQATKGFKNRRGGDKSFFGIIVIALLIIVGVYTAAYTIPAGHRGVVLRFGKYIKTNMPGLHFKIPFGVDDVTKVHTDKVDTESFGFTSVKPGIRSRFEKDPQSQRESLMLTGDLNVIDVEWIVQFRRRDPKKFLFNINNPIQTLRDISESAIRRIVGDWTFDYVLQNREEVNRIFKEELQQTLDQYDSGIYIVNVRLQNVVPPDEVKGAFNEVNEAQQEKERLINQAQETYNKEIPKARGEAERLINKSRGYALERVNRAKGETARFVDVLKEYRSAKEVTKRRMYLETYQEIIPKAKQVYIIDSQQQTILPLLELDKIRENGGGAK
ncbi:MAG: FtsH protease activity modulator HflK [Deltaproteobacteria bacterium]|nr:FtsH protease activity modulator HflK [Deltaproteobacteria bacterium]